MSGNFCHHCNQPVSMGHTICSRCAQSTNCAVGPNNEQNGSLGGYQHQQNADGIAYVLEALSVLAPAFIAGIPIFCLTQIAVLALIAGISGFVAACRLTPFGKYVKCRSNFIKTLAAGIAAFFVVGMIGSLLE